METIKFETYVDADGVLKLELPPRLANRKLEVTITVAPVDEEVDELGWPIGFFDRTYGALADDPIERPEELPPDVRDEIE
jgi:hypothetical protein